MGALTLLSNLFALELPVYALFTVVVIYVCLFGRDLLPVVPMAILCYFTPSTGNNPGRNPDSVFFPENGLYFIVTLFCLIVVALLFRIINRKDALWFFKPKRKLLLGFLAIAVAFMLGGVGTEFYSWSNFRYVLLLLLSLFFFYYLFTALIDWKNTPKDYLPFVCMVAGLTVALELVAIYFTSKELISDGQIIRDYLFTGWGIHNNIGATLTMFMPFAFYLAAVKKHGFVYNIIGQVLYLAVILRNSRNAILMGCFIYLASAVLVLLQKKNRKGNAIVYALALAAVGVVLLLFFEKVVKMFNRILDFSIFENGRFGIYEKGWEQFLNSPVCGNGFFSSKAVDIYDFSEQALFIPPRWHNTAIHI
ncbi:MAG: O-antigen ligase family protein [Clostridia bacterium]|nr:O-antigen ligase family protein [Clostridia bacterium]